MKRTQLQKRALQIAQGGTRKVVVFSLTGREILEIADVSRVSRNTTGKLIGYQRPEVKAHVTQIVEYLNSSDILFPNAIILALSSDARFIASRGPRVSDGSATSGTIKIPLPKKGENKPAWIVDGQQRTLAISKSKRQDLAMPVCGFITDQIEDHRDQFWRVNSARPLPKTLITELLPEVSTLLPHNLAVKKIPSLLVDRLNRDSASPFYGLIRRPSSSSEERKRAVVTDSSLVKAIEESLTSPNGCLFAYRNIATNETDLEAVWPLLLAYWGAVKAVFPGDWGKKPTRSRLMHGAGIRAMGRLLDRMAPSVGPAPKDAKRSFIRELKKVAPTCRWSSGYWDDLDGLAWNQVENTPRHVQLLSNVVARAYQTARGGRA